MNREGLQRNVALPPFRSYIQSLMVKLDFWQNGGRSGCETRSEIPEVFRRASARARDTAPPPPAYRRAR